MIRLAIQSKGRLNEDSLRLLREIGISIDDAKRKFLGKSATFPLEVLYLRDDDIPGVVESGAADIGIVGLNEVAETGACVQILRKLGFGQCRISLAVPKTVDYSGPDWFNGRSIAKHYQPGSYAEIPARRWSKKDVVEVVMPFTRHIDFGPDKMDSAPVDGKKADFEPAWLGTLMYGPLAMATTGISTWDEATMTVAPDLSDITLNGATEGSGADAHLYTLSLQGRTFIPDYHTDRHSTHYLRLTIPADPAATATFAQAEGIDRSALRELTLVARSRIGEQQAWQALAVKVPEYAPWAPHAYGRMVSQCEQAEQLLKADEQTLRQEDIDKTASQLNAIINSMRPGNLPELEDMATLEALMERARQLPRTEKLGQALDYAGMVVRYVSDGSGTHDMIDRATRQLQENME